MAVKEFLGARVPGVIGAGGAPALPDFGAGEAQHLFVRCVFPKHQVFDDLEETLAFALLGFFGGEEFRVAGRIVHHLGKEDGTGGGQGSARPPEVEGGGVAVPDGFLPRTGDVDGFERKSDFDQLLASDDGGRDRGRH